MSARARPAADPRTWTVLLPSSVHFPLFLGPSHLSHLTFVVVVVLFVRSEMCAAAAAGFYEEPEEMRKWRRRENGEESEK